MKWRIGISLVASICIACFLSAVTPESVAILEDELCYSMGVVGERRLFEAGAEEETPEGADEKLREEERAVDLKATYRPGEEGGDVLKRVEEKLSSAEPIDYKNFAFKDRVSPLKNALTQEEVAFVFSLIVSSSTASVPIKGVLEEISFCEGEDTLSVVAKISLDFSLLIEKYSLRGFPQSAAFSVEMSFLLNNSEISVDYEKTKVFCESTEIPEKLILFICDALFGKKDYKTLFGDAVKNVFVNAGIYS